MMSSGVALFSRQKSILIAFMHSYAFRLCRFAMMRAVGDDSIFGLMMGSPASTPGHDNGSDDDHREQRKAGSGIEIARLRLSERHRRRKRPERAQINFRTIFESHQQSLCFPIRQTLDLRIDLLINAPVIFIPLAFQIPANPGPRAADQY